MTTFRSRHSPGIGGIDDLEKKWHDMQKEYGA